MKYSGSAVLQYVPKYVSIPKYIYHRKVYEKWLWWIVAVYNCLSATFNLKENGNGSSPPAQSNAGSTWKKTEVFFLQYFKYLCKTTKKYLFRISNMHLCAMNGNGSSSLPQSNVGSTWNNLKAFVKNILCVWYFFCKFLQYF